MQRQARHLGLLLIAAAIINGAACPTAFARQRLAIRATAIDVATARFPEGIVRGPDGALWFSEQHAASIGRITTSGQITEFPVPVKVDYSQTSPMCIARGSDGNLWLDATNYVPPSLVRMTPHGRVMLFTGLKHLGTCIAAGADGNIWTANSAGVDRISPAGQETFFTLPTLPPGIPVLPYILTRGPDGAVWFSDFWGNYLGRISIKGSTTLFKMKTRGGDPSTVITTGPDRHLWFTNFASSRVGRISTGGTITFYPVKVPRGTAGPYAIAAGPDGAMWFTELYINSIGRMTLTGQVKQYPLPSSALSASHGMTLGPDNNLWFTAEVENKIVRMNPITGAVTQFPLTAAPPH